MDADKSARTAFFKALRGTAFRLFDAATDMDGLADHNARRLIEARRGLVIALGTEGKVAAELGLVVQKPKDKGGAKPRGGKS